MRRIHIPALLTAIIALTLAACTPSAKKSTPTFAKIACDETFENIFEQEVAVYEYIYPKEDILVSYMPESEAIDSLLSLTDYKSAVITRPLTQKEKDYIRSNRRIVNEKRIAVDAIALIVNPANPVEILSKKDIAEIISGQVTRWDQVEPCKLGNIQVVFDHQGSSTVKYMRDSILNGAPLGQNVAAVSSNTDVFKAVASNKNAIGIIGVSWISTDMDAHQSSPEELAAAVEKNDTTNLSFNPDIKVLKIRGNDQVAAYKPYQAYIFDGSYPLYRSVYMVTTAPGGTVSHRFFSFVTGFQGQKIIQMTGILPATVTPRMVQVE